MSLIRIPPPSCSGALDLPPVAAKAASTWSLYECIGDRRSPTQANNNEDDMCWRSLITCECTLEQQGRRISASCRRLLASPSGPLSASQSEPHKSNRKSDVRCYTCQNDRNFLWRSTITECFGDQRSPTALANMDHRILWRNQGTQNASAINDHPMLWRNQGIPNA